MRPPWWWWRQPSGEAGVGVERAAVVEHVAEGPARAGGVAQAGQDPLAGLEFGGQLGVGRLEVHEAGEVGVEPAPLGADHDHRPGSERRAGRDRVAVAGDPLGAADHQRRGEQPGGPAGGGDRPGRLRLGHGRGESGAGGVDGGHRVGPDDPVAVDRLVVEPVPQRRDEPVDVDLGRVGERRRR